MHSIENFDLKHGFFPHSDQADLESGIASIERPRILLNHEPFIPPQVSHLADYSKNVRDEIFDAITNVWPLLPEFEKKRTGQWCKYIVPIFGVKGLSETSFSNINSPNVIFLSPKSYLRTLEALIHESSHLELFSFEKYLDKIGVWDFEGRSNYHGYIWSPWRAENRPAIAVLHGAYVFSRVHMVVHRHDSKIFETSESVNSGRKIIKSIEQSLPSLNTAFNNSNFSPLLEEIILYVDSQKV